MKTKYLVAALVASHVSLFADVPLLKKEPKTAAAVSHTTRQTRPISLGVSGGSTVDFANGYCCSGTLGALVKDSQGVLYILSNTHVLAVDTVTGGNGKKSAKGDPINQPGFVDVNCQTKTTDFVGTLERWIPLVASGVSSVDAAIAKTTQASVNTQGTILEIGTISKTPKTASVGQKVKKSGRTTGLTRGSITATNATISVQYTKECAGGTFTTTFKNQILISPGTFIRPGDSGSLLVEDVTSNPKAIGLLFAGSSTIAVANPIQNVLSALNVSLVGVATPTQD
ncbi:MAG: S1 family peptidase, partial [Chlamydiales bacterium]|nr:S1 family peptidase [Chlamydiales bacterium]